VRRQTFLGNEIKDEVGNSMTKCKVYITTTTTTTTEIGLLPDYSSPTLVQTKIKIHKTTKQLQNIKITQNNKITTNQ
jgi:hypothetical protein